MENNVVYTSDYLNILKCGNDFYIQSFKKGMSVEDFNNVVKEHPEISITSFMVIKNAIIFAPKPPEKFGELKDRVNVEISNDELKAFITVYASQEEIVGAGRDELIREVFEKLEVTGVVFGLKREVILNSLCSNERILAAEGILPENGRDSAIKMYELQEVKPEIKKDGNVDHYELNLINKVKAGDWLGERLDPTPGIQGKSVRGNIIHPMPGKLYPMFYDRNSVKESHENGVTRLYALREGAVFYRGDCIGVSNHLEIGSNVDFKTGNIDFEGFVTVKGSIEDNFSVKADSDIEILGEYGVGSVREIESRDGNIYIRGGIAGKNKAIVKSRKDIFTKFISDAEVICEGTVHIGFYCLNSTITAREVIIDSPKGQIMGGTINAEVKVAASIFGTPNEKLTCISVHGFNRNTMRDSLEALVGKLEVLKNKLIINKQELSVYSNTRDLNPCQLNAFERLKDEHFGLRNSIKQLEDERKALIRYLKTHGEGEITILKKAYPNTVLEIKKQFREIKKEILAVSFYYKDGEIKEL